MKEFLKFSDSHTLDVNRFKIEIGGQIRAYQISPIKKAKEFDGICPGFRGIVNNAFSTIQLVNAFDKRHEPPAVMLCDTKALKDYVRHVTVGSTAPHTENRGVGHYQPYEHAIYFSIDDVNRLITKGVEGVHDLKGVVFEELIHAASRMIDGLILQVSFLLLQLTLNDISKQFPKGVFYWTEMSSEEEYKLVVDRIMQEDPIQIALTEHLTGFAQCMFNLDDYDYICVSMKDKSSGRNIFIPKNTIQDLYEDITHRDIRKAMIEILQSGTSESLGRLLVEPIGIMNFKDPVVAQKLSHVIQNLHNPYMRIFDLSSKEKLNTRFR